ncbi:hypothetical protein C5S39_11900 [Candidatus Methanophagaceae archaeon]|nr:hypothetical protein C5S39_11900 [Methanophagales archaeon]
MWVDVVRLLSNNPKSEEKRGDKYSFKSKKKDEKSG